MNSADRILRARQQIFRSDYYQQAKQVLEEISRDPLLLARTSDVILDFDPPSLVDVQAYECYRGDFLNVIGGFYDDQVVSRSCLITFLSQLRKFLARGRGDRPIIYLSLGTYVRAEKIEIPGIREVVFPQLEIEILDPTHLPASYWIEFLMEMQKLLFRLSDLQGRCRFRIGNQEKFYELLAEEKVPYVVQHQLAKLMDALETVLTKQADPEPALQEITQLLGNKKISRQIADWAERRRWKDNQREVLYSHTLASEPLTYKDLVVETDYFSSNGENYIEVASGGDFTPLARQFGLPENWLAVGCALGLLRLVTARKHEQGFCL